MERKRFVTFPCKGCGSTAEYDPDARGLKCPHCGVEDPIPRTAEEIEEFGYKDYLAAAPREKGLAAEGSDTRCERCGATFFTPPAILSHECPYCDAPIVLSNEEIARSRIAPEAVVPFRLDEADARDRYRAWVAKLWFAPSALKKRSAVERIRGVYRPYWTFDSFTSNHYSGERGDHYWDTVGSGKNRRSVRRTRWTHRSGGFTRFFDDVLVPAGKGLDFETDFLLGGLAPFDARFVAGWRAETYVVPPEAGWTRAKETIRSELHSDACRRIGGDAQRFVTVKTAHSSVTFKHVLLPLFIGAFTFRGKLYSFQVNGQTGDVRGRRPYSFWKIFFAVLACAAVVALGIWLYASARKP